MKSTRSVCGKRFSVLVNRRLEVHKLAGPISGLQSERLSYNLDHFLDVLDVLDSLTVSSDLAISRTTVIIAVAIFPKSSVRSCTDPEVTERLPTIQKEGFPARRACFDSSQSHADIQNPKSRANNETDHAQMVYPAVPTSRMPAADDLITIPQRRTTSRRQSCTAGRKLTSYHDIVVHVARPQGLGLYEDATKVQLSDCRL